jgi:single-stranded-DNA-specific exonuclease
MVEFLLTEDETRGRELALELENLNFQRKMAVDNVFKSAIRQLQNNAGWMDLPVLVLADLHWEAGVNGIVASRMVNQFAKPALIITKERDGSAHGSARSVAGVNIIQLISQQKDLLLSYGGHPMAAGFALNSDHIDQFRDRINIDYENAYGKLLRQGELSIDAFYPFSSIDEALAEDIEKLAPFGPGNPRVVLASRHVKILKSSVIGKNKEHLKISVQDSSGASRELIWWQGEEAFLPDDEFDLAYSVRTHDFQGRRTAQLEWLDWRESTREEISITTTSSQIFDCRTFSLNQIQGKLASIQDKNSIIWMEGIEWEGVNNLNRIQLSNADLLVILTIPPAKSVLQEALGMVKPNEIWLGGVNPGMDNMVEFLRRLAGLLIHALNQKDGIFDLAILAAMTSQTTDAVLLGTQLLAARGHLTLEDAAEGQLKIGKGGLKDQEKENIFNKDLVTVLKESAAYRRFYLSAKTENLFT